MYSLEVYGLTKRFGNTTVVNDVNLSLRSGEAFAILGPPESGKTMLIRLISGLEVANKGRVLLNGEDLTRVPASERHIGVVFQQSYGLIPHLSVLENIAMPLQSGQASKEVKGDQARNRISHVTRDLQIQHLLEHKVNTLNRGEQLRIALARGLVRNPRLLLFDEPLMQLDTPTRIVARREILGVHRVTRIPYIYATRDQPEAFALAERIAVINKGVLQQVGTRAELLNAPATLWVAQWLGFPPMNTITGYLQGTYQPDGLCYRVWAKSLTPLLPIKWTSLLSRKGYPDLVLGIRPEDIIPEWELQTRWKPSFCAVKAEIIASEWHQGKTLAQLQLPHIDDKFMAVFDIAHDQVKVGRVMTIALDPERFCLFHPRTQQLLNPPTVEPDDSEEARHRPNFS